MKPATTGTHQRETHTSDPYVQNITAKDPIMENRMEPARPSHDFFGEMRGLSLCLPSHAPANKPPVSLNAGMNTIIMACSDGMIIECQRHDETGSQKRNVQHGEHGDRDMAQPAMAYLSLLMVEGGFKSCACIGVGKLIRHAREMRLPNVTLALAAIATTTKDTSTHTVMATI